MSGINNKGKSVNLLVITAYHNYIIYYKKMKFVGDCRPPDCRITLNIKNNDKYFALLVTLLDDHMTISLAEISQQTRTKSQIYRQHDCLYIKFSLVITHFNYYSWCFMWRRVKKRKLIFIFVILMTNFG